MGKLGSLLALGVGGASVFYGLSVYMLKVLEIKF